MPEAGLQELLEAGVHFGHQTRRWNPNMRRFIHGELDGIHIIDLLQTEALLENARRFAGELAAGGGTVLFVGTKKQARDSVKEWADRCKMPYVNQRWLGGLLTNFNTMSTRIARLHELLGWREEGKLALLPTKERMRMQAELVKLEFNLGGVRDMDRLPDAVFVTDLKTEEIAVHEAARLRIPIIALVDTNCDPNPIDFVIPGNDDAIRSCQLIIGTIGEAVETGSSAWRVQEEKRIAEEMARRKKEEEERRKREEEEKARVAAEEAAKAAAEAAAAAAAAEKAAATPAAAPAKPTQGSAAPATGPVPGDGGALRAGASSTPPSPVPPAGGAAEAKAEKPAAAEEAPAEAPKAEEASTEEKAPAAAAKAEGAPAAEKVAEAKADESGAEEKSADETSAGEESQEGEGK